MPSKNYTMFFILSVGFVLVSIAFITILGQTSSSSTENRDIRAKATVQNSLQLTGVVTSSDTIARTLVLSNVRFANNDTAQDMGTFTAQVDSGVEITTVRSGTSVVVSVDASTFNAGEKTFRVLAVSSL